MTQSRPVYLVCAADLRRLFPVDDEPTRPPLFTLENANDTTPRRTGDMTKIGYKLMAEEHGPAALVRNTVHAEQAGFDFAAISDHFFPWLDEQDHSPFAWTVLGAAAQATSHIGLMTAVTCPIMRYHPAIVAQGAATMAVLSGGRFVFGLGAGERLNEHVIGARAGPVSASGTSGSPRLTTLSAVCWTGP